MSTERRRQLEVNTELGTLIRFQELNLKIVELEGRTQRIPALLRFAGREAAHQRENDHGSERLSADSAHRFELTRGRPTGRRR